jgi:hypothetical protein
MVWFMLHPVSVPKMDFDLPSDRQAHGDPSGRMGWFLMLALSGLLGLSACVDLTEPWKIGGPDTGAGGTAMPPADAPVSVVGSGGQSGNPFDGTSEVPDGAEAIDGRAGTGGRGGGVDAGDASAGLLDSGPTSVDSAVDGYDQRDVAGGSGGSDVPRGGAGGAGGSGGRGGGRTGGAGGSGGVTTGSGGRTGGSSGRTGGSSGSGGVVVLDASADASFEAPDLVGDVLPSLGLVAYYPCESADGASLPDLSGQANHGTLATGPTPTGGSTGRDAGASPAFAFVGGKVGKALALNAATNAYVDLPAGILAQASELTVATWIRVHASTSFMRVFDFGHDTYAFMYLTTNKNNAVHFRIAAPSVTDAAALDEVLDGPALAIDTWTHLALTIGSDGIALYLDGVRAASTPNASLRPSDLGSITNRFIGRSEFAVDPYLDGDIDEYRIYNRVLDAAEIAALAGG